MSLLETLNALLDNIGIPVETGVFKNKAPDEYIVITPMTDNGALFADNEPQFETHEARLSLFSKNNYNQRKKQILSALKTADITVTERRYIGHDDDTGYHHYGIDVAKEYETEE